MGKALLVFGHGYTANFLSKKLLPLGWKVYGTVRSGDSATKTTEALRRTGVVPVPWTADAVQHALTQVSNVLVCTAPGQSGDPVLLDFSQELTAAPDLAWLGYLSTTAVYGDHKGGWVDEDTKLSPTTKRGKLRVKAEQSWQKLGEKQQLPLHIFRLAGIYGPGRGPFAKVQSGSARRIIKENQVFSRIHVEDIVRALAASIAKPNPGAVYNLCDNEAAPPEDVIEMAAKLLNLPVPESVAFEAADLSPMARSFYAESKRVSNSRYLSDLNVKLKYPTYREGLKALLARKD